MGFVNYIDENSKTVMFISSITLLAGWLLKLILNVQMFSFVSSKLRASKHGNFSSSTPSRLQKECSPKMAITRDGTQLQIVRTTLLSR